MSADISRVRFDPLRDFAGVVLQQGRLLLDADFNELVALLDRRLRAETCDLTSFGPDPDHAGVAWVPRETPDAFRVSLDGGALSIGRGRMYVDGLLAENHGKDLEGFDPLLSEVTGTADTPYLEQPYWPTPDPLPTSGTHLAYLDVWQREVTHIEDTDLVEIAVGVDSTARWQTAWQVRVRPLDTPGITCDTADEDIDLWLELIRPSEGRLTTDTVDVEDETDPCELPPGSGYRGRENQTYRVEIHEGGAPGNATFKWSRENASVVLPVTEMVSSTILRLASVGKDDVLRVSTGDWVEILDDNLEFDGGLGEMRKVTVDDAERTITFAGALPAGLQPADADDAAKRHLRVRRWDEAGVVKDSDGNDVADLDATGGVITVPTSDTTQVLLEHGIVVSFSLAETGGRFRRGDYWIFAARTADTDIEHLHAAPPLGVHHHYARLGVLTFPDSETSCRRLWPPLPTAGGESCDCTVCVTPESHSSGTLTVQAAVDEAKQGGTVCLTAGVYNIGDGVEVDGAVSLRIRGQGPATKLVARGEALTITGSIGVTVENLAILSGAAASAAVRLQGVAMANLENLVILSYGSDDGGSAIELAGIALFVSLSRNILAAQAGIAVPDAERVGVYAAGLRIENNIIVSSERGIDLGGASAYVLACRISGNDVIGARDTGVMATGAVAPGGTLDVVDNKLVAFGAGIVVGADAVVDSNTINSWEDKRGTDGIVVAAGELDVEPGAVRITGNRIRDRSGSGIALRTSVRTFMVKQNVIETAGMGIVIDMKGDAEHAAIENNELFDIAAGLDTGIAVGVALFSCTSADVVGNTVVGVGSALTAGGAGGIFVLAPGTGRLTGNVVDAIGPQDGFDGSSAGIAVGEPFKEVIVSENNVRFGPGQSAPSKGGWNAVLIGSAQGTSPVGDKDVLPVEDGAIVVDETWAFFVEAVGGHVGVASNMLGGGGSKPACDVQVSGDVVADGNQCAYEVREDSTAVLLGGSSVVASSNRLRGDKAMLILQVAEDRFAALGNLAPGGTHLGSPGGGLPGPWQPLNPNVS
jgi:hypothetical protein